MNPFKNISVFRDQTSDTDSCTETKGNSDYYNSQLAEVEFFKKKEEVLQQENARLHHLTNVLIQHIWKSGDKGLPLKEIDKQMKIFDDGGIDGTPRNARK